MRVPRIRLKVWMLLVAAALPALGLGWYIDAQKRAEHRRTLWLFGRSGSRSHFQTADGWRAYLDRCRQAEAYLGITPRHFEGAFGRWTDQDERRYVGEVDRIGKEFLDAIREVEASSPDQTAPRPAEGVESRDPARDRVDSPPGGPADTGSDRAASPPDGASSP